MSGRVIIGAVFAIFAAPWQDPACAQDSKSEPLELLREAHRATQAGLRSGSGEAIFESFDKPRPADPWQLRVRAKCKIWFRDSNYHIRLEYDKDEYNNLKSLVIINDGSALLTNCQSPIFVPSGEAASIYDPDSNGNIPMSAGFPFNPSKLPDLFPSFDVLLKNPKVHLEVKRVGDDLCKGTCRATTWHWRFEATARDGYNVRSVQAFHQGSDKLSQSHTGAWARDNDSWYIKSVTVDNFFSGSGKETRDVLSYSKFAVNPSVDDALFKFEALGVKAGARILDHRRGATERIYYYNKENPAAQANPDKLTDTVSALPTTEVPLSDPRLGWQHFTLILLAVLLSGIGCVLLWRRASRPVS